MPCHQTLRGWAQGVFFRGHGFPIRDVDSRGHPADAVSLLRVGGAGCKPSWPTGERGRVRDRVFARGQPQLQPWGWGRVGGGMEAEGCSAGVVVRLGAGAAELGSARPAGGAADKQMRRDRRRAGLLGRIGGRGRPTASVKG